jgi:murein DD-endopeptidase / murein LD-carboxypeptidase
MKGKEIAARARALVGTRFRPQGRSVEDGLDCVGVAALALGIPAGRVPWDYALRGQRLAEIEQGLRGFGCRPVDPDALRTGDLAVCRTGPEQYHLAIVTPSGFVHADAGLRRVAHRPFPLIWPIESAWRLGKEES